MRTDLRGRRFGSYLALIAVIFQLAFAFGHVDLRAIGHHDSALREFLESLVTGGPPASQTRDNGKHGHHRSDSCELCWLQAVAGSATLSENALATLVIFSVLAAWIGIASINLPSIDLAYRVRAPPLSR